MWAVKRSQSRITVFRDDNEIWSARLGVGEYIRYVEGTINMAIPVDKSSDPEICYAVAHRQLESS
jgi:hypothetical protein